MGVFERGSKLWIRFRDVDGKWRNASTGYSVGDEGKAHEVLAEVESRVETQRAATTAIDGEAGAITFRKYATRWLARRKTATVGDDRGASSTIWCRRSGTSLSQRFAPSTCATW